MPSSARSSSSVANPLPQQFIPLLENTLEKVKESINKVLPLEKKLSALEEAEFEDEGGEDGALDREMFSQCMYDLPNGIPPVPKLTFGSNANITCLSSTDTDSWLCWDGAELHRRRRATSSRRLSCADFGTWYSFGRFHTSMSLSITDI